MKITLSRMLIALVVLSVVVLALDGDAALAQQATPEQISAETSEDRGRRPTCHTSLPRTP